MVPSHSAKEKGYILLTSVLIVTAVGLTIALALIVLGLGTAKNSLNVSQYNQAKALANGCAEKVLQEIRNSSSFSGNGTFVFDEGSCIYTVTNTGGENREISVAATISNITRNIFIAIDTINPKIHVTTWHDAE